MNRRTATALNRLNLAFYEENAQGFSRTRARPWPGWDRVVQAFGRQLAQRSGDHRPAVLDVGCGNGRFGVYLDQRLGQPFDYLGIDSSSGLLEIAASRLAPRDDPERNFMRLDLVEERIGPLLGGRRFDLIAAFGLLHHLPGLERRAELLADLAGLLHPGGILALAFWQFWSAERFRRRIVSWEEHNRSASEPVDPAELEEGDYLVAWGEAPPESQCEPAAVRYCHYADPAEVERLLAPLALDPVAEFRADGEGGDLNLYRVLHRS